MTIEFYIARDFDGYLGMYRNLPALKSDETKTGDWDGDYMGYLPTDSFPEVTFENSPKRVKNELI